MRGPGAGAELRELPALRTSATGSGTASLVTRS